MERESAFDEPELLLRATLLPAFAIASPGEYIARDEAERHDSVQTPTVARYCLARSPADRHHSSCAGERRCECKFATRQTEHIAQANGERLAALAERRS